MGNLNLTLEVESSDESLGNFTKLVYTVELTRRSTFFVANVLMPSILINYLSLMTFLVPTDEQTTFSVTIFLAQTVNLLSTSQFIPNGGIELPIWSKYLNSSLIFLAVIILVNMVSNMMTSPECDSCNQQTRTNCVKACSKISPWVSRMENKDVEVVPPIRGMVEDESTEQDEPTFARKKKFHVKRLLFTLAFSSLTILTIDTLVRLRS